MDETSTLNNLIRFIYNETDLIETVLIKRQIENNYFCSIMYAELVDTLEEINEISFEPSESTMNAILKYSE